MSEALYQSLFFLNMLLVLAHGVILVVLCRNTLRYMRQFGQSKVDPYTVSTLMLLGLSTTLLFINLPWMLLSFLDSESIEEWLSDNHVVIVTIQETCKIFARACFTLSIAVSAIRWVK